MNLIRTMLFLAGILPLTASAQLHTFKNGEVADADKINQNFNYVLENASGGCSATQQDNSVLIECADGTSGVIAGAGTVVVYPENGIVGSSPPASWPTGEIVWVDAKGVVLAGIRDSGSNTYALIDDKYLAQFFNDVGSNKVIFTAFVPKDMYYHTADCTGQPFTNDTGLLSTPAIHDVDGKFLVRDEFFAANPLVYNSIRRSGSAFSGFYTPASSCTTQNGALDSSLPLVEYTPAPEILNAAYPVRLEQLP